MENATMTGRTDAPNTYDYRLYDRIWQRVSPELDPYPEVRAAQGGGAAAATQTSDLPAAGSSAGMPAISTAPALAGGGADLPGAEPDPCCMGTQAEGSTAVVAGFIDEELAGCRCCMTLSRRVCDQRAARLMRRIANEKQMAIRELRSAYYLITGTCYHPAITLERRQWNSLADVLRSCYHQEACNGFNYQRSADETTDPCLARLLSRLGEDSYQRADEVMDLLGRVIH